MASKDLYSNIKVTPAFPPQALSGTTDITGVVIDTLGFDSITFVLQTDAIAAADVDAVLLLNEDTAAGFGSSNVVADADLIGLEANTNIGTVTTAKRLGYGGNKRYVRCDLTVTANTGTDVVACLAVLGHPTEAPVADPVGE